MKRAPVIGIDIARFVAATLVVIWHFGGKPFINPENSTLRALLPGLDAGLPAGWQASWFGWVGVQIFFVISGAVIAYSATGATARSFFVGRVTRLWPTMLICAAFCSVISILFWHAGLAEQIVRFIRSIVFSPKGPWFSGQVWTLPIEIVFYCLVWVMVLAGKCARLERLAWCLALLSASYWLFRTAGGSTQAIDKVSQILLLWHGCYFALGIVVARSAEGGFTASRLALIGFCILTGTLEISAQAAAETRRADLAALWFVPVAAWLVAVVFIAASMWWRDPVARVVAHRAGAMRMLGALTYPLYLVHYQIGGLVFAMLYQHGWPIWGALAAAYGAALCAAVLVTLWLEPPLRGAVRQGLGRALGGRTAPAALTAE